MSDYVSLRKNNSRKMYVYIYCLSSRWDRLAECICIFNISLQSCFNLRLFFLLSCFSQQIKPVIGFEHNVVVKTPFI